MSSVQASNSEDKTGARRPERSSPAPIRPHRTAPEVISFAGMRLDLENDYSHRQAVFKTITNASPEVKTIDLSQNFIGNELKWILLSNVIRCQIETLKIRQVGCGLEGSIVLGDILRKPSCKIRHLYASGNRWLGKRFWLGIKHSILETLHISGTACPTELAQETIAKQKSDTLTNVVWHGYFNSTTIRQRRLRVKRRRRISAIIKHRQAACVHADLGVVHIPCRRGFPIDLMKRLELGHKGLTKEKLNELYNIAADDTIVAILNVFAIKKGFAPRGTQSLPVSLRGLLPEYLRSPS